VCHVEIKKKLGEGVPRPHRQPLEKPRAVRGTMVGIDNDGNYMDMVLRDNGCDHTG
jgi:hypothetical protein